MTEPTADHPDTDALCELDEGLLAGTPAEAALRSHVAGCAACADFLAVLSSTLEELATLPAVPMPADVAARIDAALAAEVARNANQDAEAEADADAETDAQPAAAVTSLDTARESRRARGPRWTRGAGAVAAGIAVLMAGAVGVSVLNSVNERSASVSSNAEGGNAAPQADSGRDTRAQNYSQATLAADVRALVAGDRSSQAGAPQGRSASPLPLGAQQDSVGPPDLNRLRAPAQLAACVAELAGRPGVQPLAVDYANYEGEPAVIVVLPDADPSVLQAWVVGPGCSAGNSDLRHREVVPRTG